MVNINTVPQLKSFHKTITDNNQLGVFVKQLELDNDVLFNNENDNQDLIQLIELLLLNLPNLKILKQQMFRSYLPIFDALLVGKLKKLHTLNTPTAQYDESEVGNYITSALLLKDRLKNLTVSDNYEFLESLDHGQYIFNRLYNNLHLFDKLVEISIIQNTSNDFHTLEYIVEACKSLKRIDYDCKRIDKREPVRDTSYNTILSLTPRRELKELNYYCDTLLDHNILLYIMQKFSLLNSLTLTIIDEEHL